MTKSDSFQTKDFQLKRNSSGWFQRFRKFWVEYQWQIVLVAFVFSFILGYIGFYQYTFALGRSYSKTDLFYLTLQLAILESGAVSGPVSWNLEMARLLLPLITAYTAILAGAALFRNQFQMLRLKYIKNHTIICGLGEKGWLIATQLRENGKTVVVIEIDPENPKIELCREMGMIVLERDATEKANLIKASLMKASYLVAVSGRDSTNAEIATVAKHVSIRRKRGALNCVVHIANPHLCDLLRELTFGSEAFPTFRLEMFNIYERGARILASEYASYGDIHKTKTESPHLLMVGFNDLTENLIINVARSWYETWKGNKISLKITVVDLEAEEKVNRLLVDFPKLHTCCQLIPENKNPENFGFLSDEFLINDTGMCRMDSIFIFLEDYPAGLEIAFKIRSRLNCDQPPIVLSIPEDRGLSKILSFENGTNHYVHNIIPFGLIQRTCTLDLVIDGTQEILAQAVHDDYLQHRLAEGFQMGQKRSMTVWKNLPQELRESNRRQVDHIRLKLNSIGYGIKPLRDWDVTNFQFSAQEIETMALMEHEHWMMERIRNGWKYAPGQEDTQNKTHPDLLPWEALPDRIKVLDRQPSIGLPKLLAKAGFEVFLQRKTKL